MKQQENSNKPQVQYDPLMSFSSQYLRYHSGMQMRPKSVNTQPQSQLQPVAQSSKTKKMIWGEHTWYAFHSLAQKVKEDSFPTIRLELLNMITMICNNLPCPICAKHATQHMSSINLNSIQTKTQLQIMLFNFHNDVNRRKGHPIFQYDELEPKYNKAQLIPILQNFLKAFADRTGSFKLIADEMQRARLCAHIQTWFQNNLHHFDV